VAGVVGVMMSIIMGSRKQATLHHAADLGIAFQLTNIARDVIADHRAGRVYLPADWLREAGLSRATMAETANREALFTVTERLLDTAEAYYNSAACGLSALPLRSAWAVASAQRIYRAIGDAALRRGAAAWDTRISTTKATKLRCVSLGFMAAIASRGGRTVDTGDARRGLWTMTHS
ncbi:MAG: squalene/phytoene synthase family protein, partial [Alphaproteobacteria bacterium]|nr:squalene/phytoene synthase family protein [Alphaproteobacteria bacterium]